MAQAENSDERRTGIHGDCFTCGEPVPVGIWDDAALSGKLAIYCGDCYEEPPESNLWEAESEDEEHPLVKIPNLPEHKDWIVLNHYRDWESTALELYDFSTVSEMKSELDGSGPLGLEAKEILEEPEEEAWEIVVRSFDDTDAIEAAREEVRKRLNPVDSFFDE